MRIELFPTEGKFYKVNLHCHTDISDGTQSPAEVKTLFKKLGYSAVCFTDHEVLIGHKELCDEDFVALHGYEVAIKQDLSRSTGYFMPVYHFNIIAEKQDNLCMPRCFVNNPSMPGNAREWFAKHAVYEESDTIETTNYSVEWLNEYLCAVRNAGFLVTYNHPQWSIQGPSDYLGLKGLHAIEALNGSCYAQGDTASSVHFEQMLRYDMKVVPIGGDDNHRAASCGGAWTMIKAKELSYDALIDAYKRGCCYASCGPEILEFYLEDGKVNVKVSAPSTIILRGEGRYTAVVKNSDSAQFDFSPEKLGRYFRIEVRDQNGQNAFTPAFYCDEINQK